MSARSLNKVMLIGNLTRDPELRYTPSGAAVCTIGIATNRSWTTESGERKEETEFHRVVSWNKLAELCSQLLTKGRKVFVEGRLRTSTWQQQDGSQRSSTEIVIEDMILLDSKRPVSVGGEEIEAMPADTKAQGPAPTPTDDSGASGKKKQATDEKKDEASVELPKQMTGDVNPDDIPF